MAAPPGTGALAVVRATGTPPRCRRTGRPGRRRGRRRAAAPVGGIPVASSAAIPYVSPRRAGATGREAPAASLPPIAPAEPVSTYPETPGAATGPDQDDEPSVPDEARARIIADATADTPVDAGPETILHVRFARQVAAGDRGGGGRRPNGPNGAGPGGGYGGGPRPGSFPPAGRPLVPVGPGQPVGVTAEGGGGSPAAGPAPGVPAVPFVSPRRAGAAPVAGAPVETPLPPIAPAEPVSAYPDTPGVAQGPDQDDEPSVPDEARARIVADATADAPVDAGPQTILHVRFAGTAAPDRVVGAMETFKAVLRDRPGGTRVIIHVPASGGWRGPPDGATPRRGV